MFKLQSRQILTIKKDEVNMNFAEMLLRNDIEFSKIDEISSFIKQNFHLGGDLVKSRTIVDKYIPKLRTNHFDLVKESVNDKRINIMFDETTDREGRSIVAIIGKYDQNKALLLKIHYTDVVNNITISNIISETLMSYGISFKEVISIMADNASYCTKSIVNIKSTFNSRIIRGRCFAHIYNLIFEAIINYIELCDLNFIIHN